MFKKLFVANRGEIAVRIIRSARELGVRTAAGYSDADADALAVGMADEAVRLGPAEAAKSYLDVEAVVGAARSVGADAIHPGYGFLSERAELADACEAAGIVFVGPPASAMRRLGDKISAKRVAVESDVPIVPGYFEPGADDAAIAAAAAKLGFPVMLKASAGGGGRGMRAVFEPAELESELAMARDEALKAFGDAEMMVEKLVERPRHIEVQILADGAGGVAALLERECSLQRRRQKVVEEAPSPLPDFRARVWPELRDAATRLVAAAGYRGAGTVEFILDPATLAFYFLEVNARLQVEHPVTEAITGADLVAWQLRIAAGEPLDPRLRDPLPHGHAIEARIIAEDPERGFLPSVGRLLAWAEPRGPGVRVDTGFAAGAEVSRHYDSLLAKLIVHAEDRPAAVRKLRAALLDFHILGVTTNVPYLLAVLDRPEFARGEFDTGFLERELGGWRPPESGLPEGLGAVAASASAAPAGAAGAVPGLSAWAADDGFRNVRATGAE